MASTVVPQHGQAVAGEIKQKKGGAERRNRQALGEIGNRLVTVQGPDGKSIPHNRPVTRGFRAQLLAKKKVNEVDQNGKPKQTHGEAIIAPSIPKPAPDAKSQNNAEAMKPTAMEIIEISPETEKVVEKERDFLNLTTVLTARSKAACGVTDKKLKSEIEDIDASDVNNELAVVEYVEDIYKYYREAEGESKTTDYMKFQPSINEKTRLIIVNWLIDLARSFELAKPTLYLTINLMDRYLSSTSVSPRSDLQLVAMGAMLLASKYEEVWPPLVNEFLSISSFSHTSSQILKMEKSILRKLDWILTVPTPYVFLVRFIKACLSDDQMESMVYFFAELGMMHYDVTRYSPSKFAASAVYAARRTLNKVPAWNATLKKHSGYEEADLMECAKLLVGYHCLALAEGNKQVVYNKYSSSKRHMVALMSPAKSLLA